MSGLLAGVFEAANDPLRRFGGVDLDRHFHVELPVTTQSAVEDRGPTGQFPLSLDIAGHLTPGEEVGLQDRQQRRWVVERDRFAPEPFVSGAEGKRQDPVQKVASPRDPFGDRLEQIDTESDPLSHIERNKALGRCRMEDLPRRSRIEEHVVLSRRAHVATVHVGPAADYDLVDQFHQARIATECAGDIGQRAAAEQGDLAGMEPKQFGNYLFARVPLLAIAIGEIATGQAVGAVQIGVVKGGRVLTRRRLPNSRMLGRIEPIDDTAKVGRRLIRMDGTGRGGERHHFQTRVEQRHAKHRSVVDPRVTIDDYFSRHRPILAPRSLSNEPSSAKTFEPVAADARATQIRHFDPSPCSRHAMTTPSHLPHESATGGITFEAAIEQVRRGRDLSTEETGHLIDVMLRGEAGGDQVASLLLAIRDKGEAVDELVGAATAMRRHMTPIRHRHDVLLDTCGTGGSGSGTFNISTTAAIVASACGIAVAKHGNRKATSLSGSADVLSELGVAIESDVARVERTLDEVGLCFCFAPKLHPAMRHVVEVRRNLGVPTLFNLLGPLCNPAGATHQLLGTSTTTAHSKVAAALAKLGTRRSAVVHGQDGQDEVTLDGITEVNLVTPEGIQPAEWSAANFGLSRISVHELTADSPAKSAAIIREILAGRRGPCRDVVIASAAAAIWLVGMTSDLREAAAVAAEAIDRGAAAAKLDALIETR